jgi:hypothetical protein
MAKTVEVSQSAELIATEATSPAIPELRHPFYIGPDGNITDGGEYAWRFIRRCCGEVSTATYPSDPWESDK